MVLVVKNLPANAGDAGLIPGLGRSPGGENGNALQYFCLENPMDRGSWQAIVHGVTRSWTRLKQLSLLACRRTWAKECQVGTISIFHVGKLLDSSLKITDPARIKPV